MRLMFHEAAGELRAGLRSGIVSLVFVGLTLYLLMSLTNAEYMEKMGATDIPRNAPSLIYLMATGCMFFLFFAWAWVFAQPLLRDRHANLHEVVLSAPISLPALLLGRFLGAALLASLLGASVMVGFLCTPILSWLGLVPADAIAPPAWRALAFSWLWLVLPIAFGVGALYFMVTLKTRGVAAAFALSALLMLLWMVAVVVLEGGHINPVLSAILDPSLFTFTHAQVESWTPAQKTQALLPVNQEFLLNRGFWCVLPMSGLVWMVTRVRRESLIRENARKPSRRTAPPPPEAVRPHTLPGPVFAFRWWRTVIAETGWRLRRTVRTRAFLVGTVLLVAVGVMAAFVHVIWHAEGPFLPHPDRLLPLLMTTLYLVIAFLVAASAGLMSRQDDVEGFRDMLDAAPVPPFVRLFALALALLAVTLILALLPGVSALIVTALVLPDSLAPVTVLLYQILVMAPALLELAMLALLIHALIRRPGLAYAASMFVTFVLVLNNELALVTYPPYKLGIAAQISLSSLAGWAPWRDYLLTLDGYKLSVALLCVAVAGLVLPRGHLGRLREIATRLPGPIGGTALVALAGIIGGGALLHQKLVLAGSYRTAESERQEQVDWEQDTAASAGAFTVEGGELTLELNAHRREATGRWLLKTVRPDTGVLHAELPPGFSLLSSRVDGQAVRTDQGNDHLTLPLDHCAADGCDVALTWRVSFTAWPADASPPALAESGIWLRASQVAPRLGIDPDRALRGANARTRYGLPENYAVPPAEATASVAGIAPAGHWRWRLSADLEEGGHSEQGQSAGALDFSLYLPHRAREQTLEGLTVISDPGRTAAARGVADDVRRMQACVSRRLGSDIQVDTVQQWPRGQRVTGFAQGVLRLAEDPDWDVADQGVGRWRRQAHIATALARQHLVEAAELRRGPGAAWLSEGVAGAIGLLCVGDADGMNALRAVVERQAQDTTQRLANSDIPITSLRTAPGQGWVSLYAPLASLDWTARQSASDLTALLADIRQQGDVDQALAARLGSDTTQHLLGPPLAFGPDGERWHWREGGWQPLTTPARYQSLIRHDGRIVSKPGPADEPGLLLDRWPAYPRFPQHHDNK
ncbi:ABC transporter permease [Alloalcanivorax dieselolei]